MNVFTEQVPFLFIPEYGRICMDQVNRTAGIPVREKLPMYDIVRILCAWLLCLLSVLFHELGHALGYRISDGKAGWKVGVGSGPKMFSASRYTFFLIPAGGYFIPDEAPETNKAKIFTYAGGPVVSLLQAVLYSVFCFCIYSFVRPESSLREILLWISRFVLFFNFFQFLFTIIPIRYRVVCRGFDSDGLQILHTLKQHKTPSSDPENQSEWKEGKPE